MKDKLPFLDYDLIEKSRGNVLYAKIMESKISRFHNNKYDLNVDAYLKTLDLYHSRKNSGELANNPKLPSINEVNQLLMKNLNQEEDIILDVGGSNHQKRTGNTYSLFKQYYPLNIDAVAIESYANTYNRVGLVASAENMPIKDKSIDCIITNAFLEHPEYPDTILNEFVRILKPGGIVVHNDAWFCRWWQRFGLIGFKSFNKMTLKEKSIYLLAKLSTNPIIRFPPIIIGRAVEELFYSTKKPIRLRYKKLKPNFNLNLGADEHACSSIDPLSVIRFYESNGFSGYEHLSLLKRIFFKKYCLIMRKAD